MALCLINGVSMRNLPYGSHKNVYGATVMYGKLDKCFDMSSWATPKPWWSLLYSTIVLYDTTHTYIHPHMLLHGLDENY